jgi:hypothetical protein
MEPALKALLDAAAEAKFIRPGVDADDLLRTISTLCRLYVGGPNEQEPAYARRIVDLLLDGMRYRATGQIDRPRKST